LSRSTRSCRLPISSEASDCGQCNEAAGPSVCAEGEVPVVVMHYTTYCPGRSWPLAATELAAVGPPVAQNGSHS
jgi:hypothetical protein